jgi:hypothetical protein
LFRGKELSFNKLGKPTNENQTINLSDGVEWLNFLKLIKAQLFCQIEFIHALNDNGNVIEDASFWIDQLTEAVKLTPEEKGIIPIELVLPKEEIREDSKKIESQKEVKLPIGTSDKKAIREALKDRAKAVGYKIPAAISNENLEKAIVERENKR